MSLPDNLNHCCARDHVIGLSISTEGMIIAEVLMSSSSFPSCIDVILDDILSSSPK
jgi:hypothetical protein